MRTISAGIIDPIVINRHFPKLCSFSYLTGVRGYIVNGRKYMIREHRTFMEDLEKHLDLRKFGTIISF